MTCENIKGESALSIHKEVGQFFFSHISHTLLLLASSSVLRGQASQIYLGFQTKGGKINGNI